MNEHQFIVLAIGCADLIWSVQIVTAWRDHRASAAYMAELRKISASRRQRFTPVYEDCQ